MLFVCAANVCRSPLAQGLLRHKLRERGMHRTVAVRSSGIRAGMIGHKPDVRAIRVAREAGVSLAGIRASKTRLRDVLASDFIIAMDKSHVSELNKLCPVEHLPKIQLLMHFAPTSEVEEVPDPYYGNYQAFEEVFQLIDTGVTGLLDSLALSQA